MITVKQVGIMIVNLTNGAHQILSDLSIKIGGEDTGLDPHSFIQNVKDGT